MVEDSTVIKITAIVCLTAICVVALIKSIDSALVSAVSAIIGGLAGYTVKRLRK